MADLYRKSSLDKLSNPEQLDRAITISSPMSWLALIGVALIIAATVLWSVFGTLPTTADAQGVIVSPVSAGAVCSEQPGLVKKLHVKVGDKIGEGTPIATIRLSSGEEYTLKSDREGTVSELLVPDGSSAEETGAAGLADPSQVFPGTEIVRYTPELGSRQAVVCYVPLMSSQQYKEGMKVLVFPDAVDSQKYGHMEATVVSVGNYPVSVNNLAFVLGAADNRVADQFLANGPIVSMICELETDETTASGYYWSGKKSAELTVPNGSYVKAQIVLERTRPISKLFTSLKEEMEGL